MPEETGAALRWRRTPKPASTRRSMVVHLVALVIVPALGMPLFAMLFSADRLDDAESARQIAVGMQQVVGLEQVRSAVREESFAAGIHVIGRHYGLGVEDVKALLGDFPIPSIPTTRGDTDAAIRAVRARDPTDSTLAALERSVERGRSVVDETLSSSNDDVWMAYRRYDDVYELLGLAQSESVRRIMAGTHGDASPRVLAAASELDATRRLAETLLRQMSALQGIASTQGPTQQAQLVDDMASHLQVTDDLLGRLELDLSAEPLRQWEELLADPGYVTFDGFLHDLMERRTAIARGEPVEPLSIVTPGFVDAAKEAIPVSETIGEMVADAVERGVAAAQHDEAEAESRARVAVSTTAALLVVTCAGLAFVGGRMRRDLLHLASAAGRLRSGRLEHVPVEGPREIALVAEALNDAVDNLGRVTTQAELLASGGLDDPALREPVPGELGTAVHASVGRIVDVVQELERLRGELAHQAAHDRLTGLPNRAEAERLLGQTIDRANRSGRQAAVLFIDLDDFKHVNDAFGHAAGDQVLVAAAERMVANVRPGDSVCRLGGDEFLVVLESSGRELTAAHATEIAERMRTTLTAPIEVDDGVEVLIGASIGIALSDGIDDPTVVRSRADIAMYRAKADAHERVQVYDEVLDASGPPLRPLCPRTT